MKTHKSRAARLVKIRPASILPEVKGRLIQLAASILAVAVTLFFSGYYTGKAAWAGSIPESDRMYWVALYWLIGFGLSSGGLVVSLLRVALFHRQQRLLWAQFDGVIPDRSKR
jgi:hypothetical protein